VARIELHCTAQKLPCLLELPLCRPLPAIDSLLAATALAHNLVLTTRNVRDLAGLPVALATPWDVRGEPEPSPP
jgi:predicted nucleic acid-binding protein